jgi:hypothetical protein
MSYQFFLKKLDKYKKYEKIAQDRICSLYDTEILNECCNNLYDFETIENIKYEVKTDEYSIKSGNYFIEFQGYNKPSGLTTTQAAFYILTNTINYYLIDIDILRALTKNKPIRTTKDGLTYGYLINKTLIIKHSTEI